MIRQDYLLRMVAELAQIVARVVGLKARHEYGQALVELDQALAKLRGEPVTEPADVEEWIRLCLGSGSSQEQLESMADAWRERGDLLALEHRSLAAHHSYGVALGLYLERVKSGMVTRQLVDRVGECLAQTDEGPLPAAVLERLAGYYEARGWLSRAEDVLFEWLEEDDPRASAEGAAFYERLRRRSDDELHAGNLSRDEIAQGEKEFLSRARLRK